MGGVSVVVLWMLVIYLLIAAVCMLWAIAAYVMTSLSFHTIAKRRGINKPWLAWIPVANVWILGSLSDQYRYVVQNKVTNKRKVLLWLHIAVIVLMVVMMVPYIQMIVLAVNAADGVFSDAQTMQLMTQALAVLGVCFVMLVVSIVYAVFYYIALYDVYRSCDPKNTTLFLVLTILLGVVYPFFMMACRNKDLGMVPAGSSEPLGHFSRDGCHGVG
jgi:hypothetical protein